MTEPAFNGKPVAARPISRCASQARVYFRAVLTELNMGLSLGPMP
jgi:hypothetical protein